MPVAPKPYKFVCPKCRCQKIVKPKSDVLSIEDFDSICPKCQTRMDRKELNRFDMIISVFK